MRKSSAGDRRDRVEDGGVARSHPQKQRQESRGSVRAALQIDTVVVAATITWILAYRSNARNARLVLHCGAKAVPLLASRRVYARGALRQSLPGCRSARMECAGAARSHPHKMRHGSMGSVCVALRIDTVVAAAKITWIQA